MKNVFLRSWNEAEGKFYYFKNGKYYNHLTCEENGSLLEPNFIWENNEKSMPAHNALLFEHDIVEIIDPLGENEVIETGIFGFFNDESPGFYLLDDLESENHPNLLSFHSMVLSS